MDGWNTSFFLGRPIFRGYVSFRECKVFGVKVLDVKELSKSGYLVVELF